MRKENNMQGCTKKNSDFAWDLITEHVAKAFLVSPDVVEKRMEKHGIKKKYMKG